MEAYHEMIFVVPEDALRQGPFTDLMRALQGFPGSDRYDLPVTDPDAFFTDFPKFFDLDVNGVRLYWVYSPSLQDPENNRPPPGYHFLVIDTYDTGFFDGSDAPDRLLEVFKVVFDRTRALFAVGGNSLQWEEMELDLGTVSRGNGGLFLLSDGLAGIVGEERLAAIEGHAGFPGGHVIRLVDNYYKGADRAWCDYMDELLGWMWSVWDQAAPGDAGVGEPESPPAPEAEPQRTIFTVPREEVPPEYFDMVFVVPERALSRGTFIELVRALEAFPGSDRLGLEAGDPEMTFTDFGALEDRTFLRARVRRLYSPSLLDTENYRPPPGHHFLVLESHLEDMSDTKGTDNNLFWLYKEVFARSGALLAAAGTRTEVEGWLPLTLASLSRSDKGFFMFSDECLGIFGMERLKAVGTSTNVKGGAWLRLGQKYYEPSRQDKLDGVRGLFQDLLPELASRGLS